MSLPTPVRRYKAGVWECFDDNVSRELPLALQWICPALGLHGRTDLWAWPGPDQAALRELALGHVLADLLPAATGEPGCGQGFTGNVTADARGFQVELSPVTPRRAVPQGALVPDLVLERMDAFMAAPGKWDGTGCFHRAGIFLPTAWAADAALHIVEDIGRHNCLDRLAGFVASRGLALPPLFVTARVTASLYAKARRIGFTDMVSRSAVTLRAVREAQREGVRLVGFCRPKEARFTVFAEGEETADATAQD